MESDLKHIFEQHPNKQREDTIPILHHVQDEFGYLSEEHIVAVSKHLNISVNKVYGVATFYDNFKFHPKGKFHIKLCNGTGCHVTGAWILLNELEKQLNIKAGETDKEGLFSLEEVPCLGACGLAPLIEINGEFHSNVSLQDISSILDKLKGKH